MDLTGGAATFVYASGTSTMTWTGKELRGGKD